MQKQRNCMVMTGMMVFMLAASTGCGSSQTAGKGTGSEVTVMPVEESDREDNTEQNQGDEAKHDVSVNPVPDGGEDSSNVMANSNNEDTVDSNSNENSSQDIIIGGKVRSIAQDSLVISRTLVDENGYVTMPEAGSPDEELVTIRCTDSTEFEHWTIQGGGAGIEKKEAAFSDIKEDGGLEAKGYFDGEEFVANKIMIEVYK